jgi:predicted nucleotidyltransferase
MRKVSNDIQKVKKVMTKFLDYLGERNLKLEFLLEYGSQVFNLHTLDSDVDMLAVVSQPVEKYLSLKDSYKTWSDFKEGLVTIQFMDLKRFYQLSNSSNFTLYIGLQNIWFFSNTQQPNHLEFSLRKLAHHCLGLMDNNSQRQYMKAYSALFVMFLMQNGHHPTTLDYLYLLDNVANVPTEIKETLELKKQGVKLSDAVILKPYTHEQVNVLPESVVDNNDKWLNWLRQNYE